MKEKIELNKNKNKLSKKAIAEKEKELNDSIKNSQRIQELKLKNKLTEKDYELKNSTHSLIYDISNTIYEEIFPLLVDKDLKSNIKHKQIINLLLDISQSGFDSRNARMLNLSNIKIEPIANDLH